MQIALLQRQIASFRMTKPKAKRQRKQNGNGSGSKNNNRMADDPVIGSVKAILRPFDVLKGVASPLIDGRPSQKFMAKAQTQVTIPAANIMCFMVCPCAASDVNKFSMILCVGASTGGNFSSTTRWSSAVPPGTVTGLATNTPYTSGVLGSGLEVSNVGCGVKFTYEGTELNRGGTFRYIYDRDGAYNEDGQPWDSNSATPFSLVNFINSSANTIRQGITVNPAVEINSTCEEITYREIPDADNVWFGIDSKTEGYNIGPTAAPTGLAGLKPLVVGYFINSSSATISFHVDIVEHWAMSGTPVQTLQTDSYAHAPMSTHVSAILASSRQLHASTPNVHHASVTGTAVKALKSPLGHAILNDALKVALLG